MICLLLIGGGCQRRFVTEQQRPGSQANQTTLDHSDIDNQLRSALHQLQPENLGIDSQVDDAISMLNHWWTGVQTAGLDPGGVTLPGIPDSWADESLRQRLQRSTFDAEDGLFIRDAYLARAIAQRLADQSDHDLVRAVLAFEWVCRNVVLTSAEELPVPLTFYDLLIMGRGRAVDRAWVLGEILRQMKLDSVLLQGRPGDEAVEAPLLGVLVEQEVYLFDLQLGLPIPADEAPLPGGLQKPASLRHLQQHPEVLKRLTLRSDQPYEPTPEQLQRARPMVIASPNAWAARMWKLEQLLPSDALCVLYDPPQKIEELPGLLERLQAVGWTLDTATLWDYPSRQRQQFTQLTPQQRQLYESLRAPLFVPFDPVLNEDRSQIVSVVPTRQLLKTRTLQLQGRYIPAVAQYVGIRQTINLPIPDPRLIPLYQQAVECAFYWTAVCKYESQEYEGAVATLQDYLKRYAHKGKWLGSAQRLLAESQHALGQIDDALQTLKGTTPDELYRKGNTLLGRWWEQSSTDVP